MLTKKLVLSLLFTLCLIAVGVISTPEEVNAQQCAAICAPACNQGWVICPGNTQRECHENADCAQGMADPVCCSGGPPPPTPTVTSTPTPPLVTPTNTPVPTIPAPTRIPIAPDSIGIYITMIYTNITDFDYVHIILNHPTNGGLDQQVIVPARMTDGSPSFPVGRAMFYEFKHVQPNDTYQVWAYAEGYNGALGRAVVTSCPGAITALPGGPRCALTNPQNAYITITIPPPVRGTISGTVTYNFTDRDQFELVRILLAKNCILPYGSVDVCGSKQISGQYILQSGVPFPYTFANLDDGWTYCVSVAVIPRGSGMLIPFVQTAAQTTSRIDLCGTNTTATAGDLCQNLVVNERANFTLTQIALPPANPPVTGSSNLSFEEMIRLWTSGQLTAIQVSDYIATQITRTPSLQIMFCQPELPFNVIGSCSNLKTGNTFPRLNSC